MVWQASCWVQNPVVLPYSLVMVMRWRQSQHVLSVVYPLPVDEEKYPPHIIGVAVFELLKIALQYMGVNANAQCIAIGIVIFVAISLDIRKYVARK